MDTQKHDATLDYKKVMENYLDSADWRVKESSTVTYSIGGLILSNSGAVTANYWLNEIYDKEIADAHKNADIHLHDLSMLSGYCFTGDTRVKTLDGKNPTLEELSANPNEKFWVFAYDDKKKEIVPALAENARKTRTVNRLVKVTLTDGAEIFSTEDHPYMLRDGSYKKASELKPNTSLMPLYVSSGSRYCMINRAWYDGKNQGYLHRWVVEKMLGRKMDENEVVHHINGDKHDNRPENLEVMADNLHRGMEIKKTMQTEKWKRSNASRLIEYNQSEGKRKEVSDFAKSRTRTEDGRFITFAYIKEADKEKKAYNHCVRKVETFDVKPTDVYDITVPKYHNFALNSGVFVHNCAGWNLKQLIKEGLGGVEGRIASTPARHLSTLCNQMVNFLGILQNEWAGAQAFSSFDTYLAPFVKVDNLSYKQVKQCIQSFVYGVNTPSRWGCLSLNAEVLSADGFKKYNELKEGDLIYTWKDGELQLNPVRKVIRKPFKGKLHSYKTKNYNQIVTPNHRMLVRKHNSDETMIKRSEEIFDVKTPFALPVAFKGSAIGNEELNEDLITLAAMVYTDGSFLFEDGKVKRVTIYKSPNRFGNDELKSVAEALGLEYTVGQYDGEYGVVNQYKFYGESARFIQELCGQKERIADKFLTMSKSQARLFLDVWACFDGDEEKQKCQYDNDTIRDQLQQIAILSGRCSYLVERKLPSGKTVKYVKIRKVDSIYPTERVEVEYDGDVWCPNVENGTAVFRENGVVFISGQTQAPFTNITLDWTVPEDLANEKAIVGGEEMDFTYGDCQKEMDIVNKAFIEVFNEGDANGRGFQYPIPTYSITKDFDWGETENNKLLFEMAAKLGTPYFSNYVNSDMKPSDIRSMCCRLRLDLHELRKKNGGYFGSGESTGSVGVVTINLPRLGYLAENEKDFYDRLDKLMDISARSLDIKRKTITEFLNRGLYPYTKRYLGGFDNHFSTIGMVGMNEACLNAKWIREDLSHEKAHKFAEDVLNHMRDRLVKYQEQYKCLFNLEATPAESTAYRLAKHDVERYPDIITAAPKGETPYYTNSSHLPVGFTTDVFTALDLQDPLQILYTSGTVFHTYLGERLQDWKSAALLVRKIAENYKLPYFTLSPTYSICKNHGYLVGEVPVCPICGEKTEVWSRITGYYRPISNWNDGKVKEFEMRKEYEPEHSGYTPRQETKEVEVEKKTSDVGLDKGIYLFGTKTCPKCKAIKNILEDKGIAYTYLDASENADLVDKLDIYQAPTVAKVANGKAEVIEGFEKIKKTLL